MSPFSGSKGETQIAGRKSKFDRLGRYVARHGWLHLILLVGVGIFIFPFVWMVATSLKTDEELTDPSWWPEVPTFRAQSPYVLPTPALVKPMEVAQATWDERSPKLLEETRKAVSAEIARQKIDFVDATEYREAASAAVVNQLAARLNIKLWDGAEPALLDAYRALLTPDIVQSGLQSRLARFEVLGLLLRSLDAHIYTVADSNQIATQWKVESGDGQLLKGADGVNYLRYHFDSASSDPVVLRYDFDFPVDPNQLHKLMFSFKADNSWHQVDAMLDVGGKRWKSERPSYVAQTRPGSIPFQPPTFEDDTYKPKLWIPFVESTDSYVDSSNAGKRATLRLTLSPSSTTRAIYAKAMRNYSRAFYSIPFWTYVGNSLILVALITIGTLFSSTFVAYAFARLRWPGRGVALAILLATMMLPAQVTMIPSFMIWRTLGWYNTLNPLWVPAWLGGAFFIFLMVQHMKTIPRELEEAARIDGLNAVQTWWYIFVPLVKPAAAAIAIMTVMGAWNEFMGPLIYLRDQSRFPLSLGLFAVRADQASATDWTMLMAGNVLMTLPVIVMFLAFQKYFVKGMVMSGMKG
ncbi:MAG TPA: ABC transporter permease subunit [Tepidisphaeraceae bacterium]|nr:ABC transporter permease subunit [Tepidisphaeraceae bacterium]